MTPKEKAKELVQKFRIHQPVWEVEGDAKQSALIAVGEILNVSISYAGKDYDFYKEVKQEIEKL